MGIVQIGNCEPFTSLNQLKSPNLYLGQHVTSIFQVFSGCNCVDAEKMLG